MARFPEQIQNLIDDFNTLPGIGRKTAERLVFFVLKQNAAYIHKFSGHFEQLSAVNKCQECHNFSFAQTLCSICDDPKRDKTILCLVEEHHDLNVIEETDTFRGLYHILGGVLNPLEGITPDKLNLQNLIDRIKKNKVTEVILALNPDMQGEATIMYLNKFLQPIPGIKITRLARGLPMGSDIEYADEVTLANALSNRREVN
ncbi:TPA: recombination protein RecR [Candidatus Falkowbacteria bacterium]|nr:recombination protein RecR [Candidatus Falkowbacteria bacterium]